MRKKNHKQALVFTLFFIVSVVFLQFRSIGRLPTSVHAWAQSDHYALSLGFLNNEFDFFHPETFALNHQFPPSKELSNPQGITAVDFPILHFIVAFFMKVFGTNAPWVFRLTSILFSFFGLFSIFKAISKIKGIWEAMFVVGFLLFQPIYIYYQGGFHVSSAAFNVFLVGLSQMLLYYHTDKRKYIYWGYFFLTLAGLMRFINIISLIALLCMHVVQSIKTHKVKHSIYLNVAGIILIAGYFIYNKSLAARYGSVFLGSPIVADSWRIFIEQGLKIGIMYARGFLPFTHFAAFAILIYLFFKDRIRINEKMIEWKAWLTFSFLGTLCFTCLMSWSLSIHDYYSLDTWLPVLSIAVIFLIYNTDFSMESRQKALFVIIFLTGIFSVSFEQQNRKYAQNKAMEGADLVIHDFKDASRFLNDRIKEGDKVLIICGSGWNTPMVAWQHKAYRVAWHFKENIPKALSQDYDYILTHNPTFHTEVLSHFPNFESHAEKIADNGAISIWIQRK